MKNTLKNITNNIQTGVIKKKKSLWAIVLLVCAISLIEIINIYIFHDSPSDEVVKAEDHIIKDLTGIEVDLAPVK